MSFSHTINVRKIPKKALPVVKVHSGISFWCHRLHIFSSVDSILAQLRLVLLVPSCPHHHHHHPVFSLIFFFLQALSLLNVIYAGRFEMASTKTQPTASKSPTTVMHHRLRLRSSWFGMSRRSSRPQLRFLQVH